MIFLISGERAFQEKVLKEIERTQQVALEGAEYLSHFDFEEQAFFEKIPSHKGLFGELRSFIIRDALHSLSSDLGEILNAYRDTEHTIIFLEDSVSAKNLKHFREGNIPIYQEKEKKKQKKDFNTFLLADLLGRKDKKGLWLHFQEAREREISNEEIHGILFWELKTLLLVKRGDTKSMNSFVLKKNERYAEAWTERELLALMKKLLKIFHTRDAIVTMDIALEKFILQDLQ